MPLQRCNSNARHTELGSLERMFGLFILKPVLGTQRSFLKECAINKTLDILINNIKQLKLRKNFFRVVESRLIGRNEDLLIIILFIVHHYVRPYVRLEDQISWFGLPDSLGFGTDRICTFCLPRSRPLPQSSSFVNIFRKV